MLPVAAAVLALAAPATGAAKSPRLGSGSKTCQPKPGANCAGVKAKGKFKFHGDLSRINLKGAKLVGANLSGANLYRANLAGADLRGANMKGAFLQHVNLKGAKIGPVKTVKASQGTPGCNPNCSGAKLSYADLSYANLYGAEASFFGLLPARITFVIGKDRIIRHAFSSQMQPTKHIRESLTALIELEEAQA